MTAPQQHEAYAKIHAGFNFQAVFLAYINIFVLFIVLFPVCYIIYSVGGKDQSTIYLIASGISFAAVFVLIVSKLSKSSLRANPSGYRNFSRLLPLLLPRTNYIKFYDHIILYSSFMGQRIIILKDILSIESRTFGGSTSITSWIVCKINNQPDFEINLNIFLNMNLT